MKTYTREPDDYDLERSAERERQLDRDFEREPYGWYRRPRRRPRYFAGIMFRPIPATDPVADNPAMSYIAVDATSQGRFDDGTRIGTDEGCPRADRGVGASDPQSAGADRVGAVPGVAA